MKDRYVFVTLISDVFTDEALKRIDEHNEKINSGTFDDIPKDSYGRSMEWYEENNLTPPEDLKKRTIEWEKIAGRGEDSRQGYQTTDEDFEQIYKPAFFDINDFKMAVDSFGDGCTIYLNNGFTLDVLEEVEDVYFEIRYLQRSNWQIFKDWAWHKWINNPYFLHKRRKQIKNGASDITESK